MTGKGGEFSYSKREFWGNNLALSILSDRMKNKFTSQRV